jgi:hypothetical protein
MASSEEDWLCSAAEMHERTKMKFLEARFSPAVLTSVRVALRRLAQARVEGRNSVDVADLGFIWKEEEAQLLLRLGYTFTVEQRTTDNEPREKDVTEEIVGELSMPSPFLPCFR